MRTLAEVLALQDTDQKIYYLKKARKTDLPDAVKLYNDWNPNRHEIITDEENNHRRGEVPQNQGHVKAGEEVYRPYYGQGTYRAGAEEISRPQPHRPPDRAGHCEHSDGVYCRNRAYT